MTIPRTPAIPTHFDGTVFRSRLEARWAAFFRSVEWDYVYEPFDGHGYIPDFVLQGARPVLVEVKPASTLAEFCDPIAKVTRGVAGVWEHEILIVGTTPLPTIDSCFEGGVYGNPPLGLLGEYHPDLHGWDFEPGNWMLCLACRQFAFFHSIGFYAGRPCGHHEGDSYMGPIGRRSIEQLWAEAGNQVRWHGATA